MTVIHTDCVSDLIVRDTAHVASTVESYGYVRPFRISRFGIASIVLVDHVLEIVFRLAGCIGDEHAILALFAYEVCSLLTEDSDPNWNASWSQLLFVPNSRFLFFSKMTKANTDGKTMVYRLTIAAVS